MDAARFKVQWLRLFKVQRFKVQRPHGPTLNLERETLNRAEGATLNLER
jgi:hypothetical protein